jgi:hypothetical protein
MRKKRSDPARVDVGELRIPTPTHYSSWYHTLTIDKLGRLILAYFYYSHCLTGTELADYQSKWDEGVPCAGPDGCEEHPDDPAPRCKKDNPDARGPNPHDPVLLVSSDGGDSWKIATTSDTAVPWIRLAADTPALSDEEGWDDVTNYSTIQTAVVNKQ